MFVKQIIVQGFKSYKEQTIIEPFSKKTNVIVGRNGSGKSNFFAAIQFVLSDQYNQMGREQRQALLHEGSGSAVATAYVEIIFDNSDDRFPTGGKEVTIRRTIALKKDEYSLDKRVVQKSEIEKLLESAGFSKSNPYYIVPQGRVTKLTTMKESERLDLLKRVAGTEVYEARRAESLRIMTETNAKREKIDELLDYITDRLNELEEEKEELRGFQERDKERRCLEYAYHYQQQQALTDALDEIDQLRQGAADGPNSERSAFQAGEKAIADMTSKIQDLQQRLELLRIERSQLDEDRRDTAKARAKAELKARTLDESRSARDQAKAQHDAEMKQVNAAIKDHETKLAKLGPQLAARKREEEKARNQFELAEGNRNRLLKKQTHSSRFKNRAERDKFLQQEINELSNTLGKLKANGMDAQEEVTSAEQAISKLESEIGNLRSTLDGWGGNREAVAQQLSEAQDALDALDEERKKLRREDEMLDSSLANARKEREKAERNLSKSVDPATARGLATIRRLKQKQSIPGAYGILAELMDVNEMYQLPAELVAGGSLFHYVVDNEKTATFLANTLHKERGGRITFMPLEQLRPKVPNLPRASDVVPLISKIKFEPKYEKAFQQVFGRTVVCPNLAVAGQYARSHGVDGITIDGHMTNKRGAVTGGYVDLKKSRLDAFYSLDRYRDQCEELEAKRREIANTIDEKSQLITKAMGNYQKLEQRMRQVEGGLDPLNAELRSKSAQLERSRDHLEAAARRQETVETGMKKYQEEIQQLEDEIATDFKKALTNQEEHLLEELNGQVAALQQQYNEAKAKWRELEKQRQLLDLELRQNFRPRLDQLSSLVLENDTSTGGGGGYAEAQRELKKSEKAAAEVELKLQQLEQRTTRLAEEAAQIESARAEKEEHQQELARQIEKQQKRLEKSVQRKALLTTQAADCAKHIRDLGVLPEEAFGKYQRMEAKQISNRLKKCNEALKKYKHVNKKAFEQYNNFTTQQEQLLKRREELDTSQNAIEELVAHLDEKKDEAIERTFKQVSKEFSTIFERLVPAGHGRLVIQRRADRRQEPEDSDEEHRGSVESYTGVGISVSFNSKQYDEQQRIQQLSGGQKSLCALCLIFALQQTESSPMVIFDEVDANLDAQYRTAVAGLLVDISTKQGTQFICTTFRPEIVHVADKCYGVSFLNKTSSINCVPTEEALEFVEGQQNPRK